MAQILLSTMATGRRPEIHSGLLLRGFHQSGVWTGGVPLCADPGTDLLRPLMDLRDLPALGASKGAVYYNIIGI